MRIRASIVLNVAEDVLAGRERTSKTLCWVVRADDGTMLATGGGWLPTEPADRVPARGPSHLRCQTGLLAAQCEVTPSGIDFLDLIYDSPALQEVCHSRRSVAVNPDDMRFAWVRTARRWIVVPCVSAGLLDIGRGVLLRVVPPTRGPGETSA